MPVTRRGSIITGTTSTGGGGGSGSNFYNVLNFGLFGNGVVNDTAALKALIVTVKAAGGGRIYFPGAHTYLLGTSTLSISLDSTASNIIFYGDGPSSVLKRDTGNLASGVGLFDLSGHDISFEDLLIDGSVIASTGLDWSTISDPMAANLTQNTTIWTRGGAKNLRFSAITIQHTGGYAILLDATSTGDIDNVDIGGCLFTNNRPHTFGTGGINTYQSWTGGIHYQSDGNLHGVTNVKIHHSTFRRTPGSCIWGHLYAFSRLHENILVDSCTFTDYGLEGVEHGGLDGGGVVNCRFRRGGFVTGNSDLSAPTPAWLSGHTCSAIDTSGLTKNLVYANNQIFDHNGGYIDMDGFGQGTVTGNTCFLSSPSDPEYIDDQVASFGPGGAGPLYCYGVNCGNTSGQNLGGASNVIAENFFGNLGSGALRLYACRNCKVTGNNINHPSAALSPPIIYGPIGVGANFRATANVITNNSINYNPSTFQPAIFEDGVTVTPFVSTDKNLVFGNTMGLGSNVWEFSKDANSGSVSRVMLSSVAPGLSTSSENWIQRESALLRWYKNVNGTSVAVMTLQDAGTYATLPTTPGPLLNVTNGSGNGGTVTTGARTTSAFDDAMLTGKVYIDGHLCLTDTTFSNTDAGILGPAVALLRFRPSVGFIEKSTSVTGTGPYTRIWTPLSLSIGGADTQVQYNNAGALAGSTNFTWTNGAQVVAITGVTATAGLVVLNSYIQSSQGFVTPSLAYNSIQTPSGGFLGAGIGLAPASSKGGYIDIAPLNYTGSPPNFPTPIGVLPSFGATDALLWVGALNGTVSPVTTQQLQTNIAINSAVGFVTNNTLVNSIQAPLGGMTGRYFTTTDSLFFIEEATPPLSGAGQSRIYMDSITHALKISSNNGAYIPFGGSTVPGGANTNIQYNNAGAFAGSGNLVWSNGAQALTITGTALSNPGINVLTGYVSSDGGFVTSSASDNAIQTPSGGVSARRHISTFDIVAIGINSGFPTGAAGQGKLYFDNTTSKWMVIQATGAAVPMLSGSTAAGSNTQVQFNLGGVFGASPSFTYNDTTKLLSVFGIANTAGIAIGTGYAQSDGGFLVTSSNTSWNSIQTSGGIKANGAVQAGQFFLSDQGDPGTSGAVFHAMAGGTVLVMVDAYNLGGGATPGFTGRFGNGSPGSMSPVTNGQQLMSFSGRGSIGTSTFTSGGSGAVVIAASENWGVANQGADVLLQTTTNGFTSGSRTTRMAVRNSGLVECFGVSGSTGVQLNVGWFVAADGTVGGFHASGNQFNVIQAPSGGVYVGLGVTTDQALYSRTLGTGITPNTPSFGYSGFGHRSGSTFWYYNPSLGWSVVDFAASGVGGAGANGFLFTGSSAGPFPSSGAAAGLYCGFSFGSAYLISHDGTGGGSSIQIAAQTSSGLLGGSLSLSSNGGVTLSGTGMILNGSSGNVLVLGAFMLVSCSMSVGTNIFTAGRHDFTNGSTTFAGNTLNGGNVINLLDNVGGVWPVHFRGGVLTST